MFLNERSRSRAALLLYLLAAILVVYVLFKVIPPYIAYYSMDDEVSQEVGMSTINSDSVIIDDLYKKAQELDLPIDKEDIVLTRVGDRAAINVKWTTEVDFGYGFKRELNFEIKPGAQK